jgi:hypothetical protein
MGVQSGPAFGVWSNLAASVLKAGYIYLDPGVPLWEMLRKMFPTILFC